MKRVILAVFVVFAATAVNAAWNQECFYGACCVNGVVSKGCKKGSGKKKCPASCKTVKAKNGKKGCACGFRAKPAPAVKPAPAPVAQTAAAQVPAQSKPVVVAAPEPKLEVGKTVNIAGSNFASNSAEVSPGFESYLRAKSSELKNIKYEKVIIIGHTDSIGDPAYNRQLSEQRAAAVANAFIKNGVPAMKVEYRGEGASRPVAPNNTSAGRAQNRRVEITVK
jgi:outer membrane protein OmpA-like peptidoglycan-associated protein